MYCSFAPLNQTLLTPFVWRVIDISGPPTELQHDAISLPQCRWEDTKNVQVSQTKLWNRGWQLIYQHLCVNLQCKHKKNLNLKSSNQDIARLVTRYHPFMFLCFLYQTLTSAPHQPLVLSSFLPVAHSKPQRPTLLQEAVVRWRSKWSMTVFIGTLFSGYWPG